MIVSTNNGGISNRIKSLVSCIRINRNNFKVKWDIINSYDKHNHILNCTFNKLFSNDIEVKNIDKNIHIYNSHCLSILNDDDLPINFNNFK